MLLSDYGFLNSYYSHGCMSTNDGIARKLLTMHFRIVYIYRYMIHECGLASHA